MPSVQIQDAIESKNRVKHWSRKKVKSYSERHIANSTGRFLNESVFIYSLSNLLSKKDFSFALNLAY
ncbi:hypothetical protein D0784_19735 [Vibrio campbellii]|nr:hypothetical protein D0784_19735 [Vibrio campbellii]OPH53702.1 hypothetical protein B4U81_05190 [Vibrio campbellii]PQJ44449.1 hypothetical protein BTN99_14505 [Vibrio campbellii]